MLSIRNLFTLLHSKAIIVLALCLVALAPGTQGQVSAGPPAGFTDTLIYSTLAEPTALRFAPDGRLYVLGEAGQIYVFQNDVQQTSLTISGGLPGLLTDGERGLLGIAFPPNFLSNAKVYLYYTTSQNGIHNRIARYNMSGSTLSADGTVFDLELLDPGQAYHNGGGMDFRQSDGKLYVAVGENYQSAKAQAMDSQLGKILRLNPDLSIPTDNPFYATATGNNRAIWALGLRNPFTFAFQPGTNRMFINDVGQDAWEEINDGMAGANYGWPTTEGDFNQANFPGLTRPIYSYSSANPLPECSIIGGAFYNPTTVSFPASYIGDYFYADHCSDELFHYDVAGDTSTVWATGLNHNPVGVTVDPNSGAIYYISRNEYSTIGDGQLRKITSNSGTPGAPTITDPPNSITVAEGETATFTCAASGTGSLTYSWTRNNGPNIPGATSASYTTPPTVFANDNGAQFRCVATIGAISATSTPATLTVQQNRRPTANITSPTVGTRFDGGTVITYAGTATDPDNDSDIIDCDITLPNNLNWRIDLHHDDHTHEVLSSLSGTSGGTFTIPTSGHLDHTMFYRFYLTVTDSCGLAHVVTRDVNPNVVDFSLRSQPSGLKLTLEDQPHTTTFNTQSVVNLGHEIGAPLTQVLNGTLYTFQYWQDDTNAPAERVVTTPNTNAIYTAVYAVDEVETNAQSTQTPTLTWVRIPWALGYEIQIEDDAGFDTNDPIYHTASIPADAVSYITPTLPEGRWYWRLRALRSDGIWGSWSSVSSFTVIAP